jgi:hypothetical protein
MNVVLYLQNQLENINEIFHAIADDLTYDEWLYRPSPHQNMLGFAVWHIPRTQDAHVQTWIRGIPEVAHRDRWQGWQSIKQFGYGVGITLDQADEIARCAQQRDVSVYADEVHQEIIAWLQGLPEIDLDRIPDIPSHLSPYPEYQTAGYVEETKHLFRQPIWDQLMRPCIGHVHRHLGEVEILKNMLRDQK